DGLASPAELEATAYGWEKPYLPYVFPAFDDDGDGQLSLLEFRGHPFGNMSLAWNVPRKDTDKDGRLSLAEFHPTETWPFLGISAMLFERLDRDHSGWLEIREYAVLLDFNDAPPEAVFAVLDQDGDQRLTVQESVSRLGAPPDDPAKKRGYDEKLIRVEDAFHRTDRNSDGAVSLNEFSAPESTLAAVASGRPANARKKAAAQSVGRAAVADVAEGWNWRFIGLVGFNVLLVVGVAWYFLRSP
ncbi:MAG: hypothetical protein ACK5Q5_02330, partial [Planctomycetaceae bacterium]